MTQPTAKGPTVPPAPPGKPTEKPAPEINSQYTAEVVGNLVSGLWKKYEAAKDTVEKLVEEGKQADREAAERNAAQTARIIELERQNEDLRTEVHAAREELILAREDSAALRADIGHLQATINGSAERVRQSRDSAFLYREDAPRRADETDANIRAIEEALLKTADLENEKNAEIFIERVEPETDGSR